MKPATYYFSVSHNSILSRLLLCTVVLLFGCKSYGPFGSPDFDPGYKLTLDKNEQLLFSSTTELVDGTYMEAEEVSHPLYEGVLLLTNERMMFALWNEKQQRYEPSVWAGYSHIAQVKMHNNILMQYIAITVTDGSKYTYLLGTQTVDPAYSILMDQIRKNHKDPMSAGQM
jgi:hypothetical protein